MKTTENVKELLEAKELLQEMKKKKVEQNTTFDYIVDLINKVTGTETEDDINYYTHYYNEEIELLFTTYKILEDKKYDIDADENPDGIEWLGTEQQLLDFLKYGIALFVDWQGEGFYIRNTGFVAKYMKAKHNKSETEQIMVKVDILEEIVDYLLDTIK